MDVSAFEADTGDPLTWREAFERLPPGVRVPIQHGASLCRGFGGVMLFIVTLAGCVVAFCLMIVWIGLYWVLTRLLLKTTTLLRIVYEEPKTVECRSKGVEHRQPEGSENDSHVSIENVPHKQSNVVFTKNHPEGSDASFSSAKAPHPPPHAVLKRLPEQQNVVPTPSNTRDEALQRILEQEKELDAKIQAFSANTDAPWYCENPFSGTFDFTKPQVPRPASVTSHVSLATPEPKSTKTPGPDVAEVGNLTNLKTKSSSYANVARRADRPDSVQHMRTLNPGPMFTAEQLREAAKFAKGATKAIRGAASVKVSKGVGSSKQKPNMTLLNTVNAARTLDPRAPTTMNFNFSIADRTSIPPHLRKLAAAKAAKSRNEANEFPNTSAGIDLLTPEAESHAPDVSIDDSTQPDQTLGAEGSALWHLSQPTLHRKQRPAGINVTAASQLSKPISGNEESKHKAKQNEIAMETSHQIRDLQRDAEQQPGGQQHGMLAESEGEPTSVAHDGAPLVVGQNDRGMPMEMLKSLNPGSQRQNGLPGSFLAKIERGLRVISGEEDSKRSTQRSQIERESRTATINVDAPLQLRNGTTTNRSRIVLRHAQSTYTRLPEDKIANGPEERSTVGTNASPKRQQGKTPMLHSEEDSTEGFQAHNPLSSPSKHPNVGVRAAPINILSQQFNSNQQQLRGSPERRAISKQILGILQGTTDDRHGSTNGFTAESAVTPYGRRYSTAFSGGSQSPLVSTPELPHEQGSHHLDLLGLEFSVSAGNQSIATQADQTSSMSSSKESLARSDDGTLDVYLDSFHASGSDQEPRLGDVPAQLADKTVKLSDLKTFSANFNPSHRSTDGPEPTLAKDADKKRDTQSQASTPTLTPTPTPKLQPTVRSFTPSSVQRPSQVTRPAQTIIPAHPSSALHNNGSAISQYLFGGQDIPLSFDSYTGLALAPVASSYAPPVPPYSFQNPYRSRFEQDEPVLQPTSSLRKDNSSSYNHNDPAYQGLFAYNRHVPLFQGPIPSIYPPITHNSLPLANISHFSPRQQSREFAPTFAAKSQALKSTISKAVKIVKPPEVKYDTHFPKLPSSKANEPGVKSKQPPPGLNSAGGVPSDAFDALLLQRPAATNAFDALVGKGTKVATLNPFDALVDSSGEAEAEATTTSEGDPSEATDETAQAESGSAAKANQKKRKQTRAALAKAWIGREAIRKRVLGTDTLDGRRALQDATHTYNHLRGELANHMASGELREEDCKMFPSLSPSDLRAPNAKHRSVQKLIPEDKVELSTPTEHRQKSENKAPKKSEDEIKELTTKAINSRNRYVEAYAVRTRALPQGRAKYKDVRLQEEKRIDRADKIYAMRREELTAAYGGALPADVNAKLWVYDDPARKRDRDA